MAKCERMKERQNMNNRKIEYVLARLRDDSGDKQGFESLFGLLKA